jgi:xanthosine phosphorylase
MSVEKAAAIIAKLAPGFTPEIGLVLGSGIGPLAERIENPIRISYADLPGFPVPSVAGHAGELVLGTLGGRNVACLRGRVHMYEGHGAGPLAVMVRTLKAVGCKIFFATCAAGSNNMEVGPGGLMLISDHINFQGMNPLTGPNDESIGPRFLGMDGAYDSELRAGFKAAAKAEGVTLAEGVYMAFLGPTFETPAEIRMAKAMGADAVGMSTVPDCILARHCGMRVIACAVITNFAAGLYHEALSHEHTLKGAAMATENLQKLVLRFLKELP